MTPESALTLADYVTRERAEHIEHRPLQPLQKLFRLAMGVAFTAMPMQTEAQAADRAAIQRMLQTNITILVTNYNAAQNEAFYRKIVAGTLPADGTAAAGCHVPGQISASSSLICCLLKDEKELDKIFFWQRYTSLYKRLAKRNLWRHFL